MHEIGNIHALLHIIFGNLRVYDGKTDRILLERDRVAGKGRILHLFLVDKAFAEFVDHKVRLHKDCRDAVRAGMGFRKKIHHFHIHRCAACADLFRHADTIALKPGDETSAAPGFT